MIYVPDLQEKENMLLRWDVIYSNSVSLLGIWVSLWDLPLYLGLYYPVVPEPPNRKGPLRRGRWRGPQPRTQRCLIVHAGERKWKKSLRRRSLHAEQTTCNSQKKSLAYMKWSMCYTSKLVKFILTFIFRSDKHFSMSSLRIIIRTNAELRQTKWTESDNQIVRHITTTSFEHTPIFMIKTKIPNVPTIHNCLSDAYVPVSSNLVLLKLFHGEVVEVAR